MLANDQRDRVLNEVAVMAKSNNLRFQNDEPDTRTDDASPVQKVFEFDGYDIGLQYLPGDTRHDRTLKVGYGHIRETKAEDGMALDCYVHKRVCSQERNPAEYPIFAITQLDQEGEFDELKLMIGWNSEEGAIASYITAMPVEMFGGIEQFSEDDLNQYWQDSADAADSEDSADSDDDDEDDDDENHEDAFPKVKRMLDVGNVKLAITHDPMESRFSQGRPMRSHYGFANGTYGQADDGKAFDFYVHPNHANAEPTLFQIVQTTQEGEPDESKFMAYYPSMREAKDDFIYHAGSERFGYIRPFEWEAFDAEDFEDDDEDLDELEDEDDLGES